MLSRTALLSLLALFGCARGVTLDRLDAGPPATTSEASTTDDATGPVGNADSGANDDTKDANPSGDAMASSPDAGAPPPPPPSCALANSCETAVTLAQIAGDTGSDTRMSSGTTSQWLSVKVVDTTLTGDRLRVSITLTSQDGANYDLFVLQPDEAGGHEKAPKDCAATPVSSQNASGVDLVKLDWDDVTNQLGQDDGDGLVIAMEVRHISGPCGSWALTVAGNPP